MSFFFDIVSYPVKYASNATTIVITFFDNLIAIPWPETVILNGILNGALC